MTITIHLFWFYGWNVVAYVGSKPPVLLGFRYTNRLTAEGLLAAQLRKAMRLFPEANVLPGSPRIFHRMLPVMGQPDKHADKIPNMSEDTCPLLGDLSDFLPSVELGQ